MIRTPIANKNANMETIIAKANTKSEPQRAAAEGSTDCLVRCHCCGAYLPSGIGGVIRSLRDGRGWTLDDLHDNSGISKGFLSNLENGKRDIGLKALTKVAKAFDLPASELLKMQEFAPNTKPGNRGSENE